MIPFIKYYAKGIVTAIGMIAALATAFGLQHQHYVAIILGALSTIGVVLAPYVKPDSKPASAAAPARPAAR